MSQSAKQDELLAFELRSDHGRVGALVTRGRA